MTVQIDSGGARQKEEFTGPAALLSTDPMTFRFRVRLCGS